MTDAPAPAKTVARLLAGAGVLVILGTLIGMGATGDIAAILTGLAFSLWGVLPYAALLIMGRLISNPWAIAGAGLLALTLECAIRAAIFIWPQGSTAAVMLVFSPIWLTVGALPVGALSGFVAGRLWRTGNVFVRALVILSSVAALGLVAIGVARPELFPTAVLFRREMLERVGEPRIVSGADAFESSVVSNRPAWSQAANLDGAVGDELVIVENGQIEIRDGVSFEKRQAIALGGDGRLWNWFSRLTSLNGRIVIVQTGGGFSDTEVRATDGELVWSYRPDPSLAPTALRAGDLDGDGTTEFYASTRDALVRLDPTGKEVWKQTVDFDSIVELAPKTEKESAIIVGSAYEGRMFVWNEAGVSLGRLNSTSDGSPVSIVDFPKGRAIATVGKKLQLIGLDGKIVFEHPGEEGMRFTSAVSLRPGGLAHPYLAVVMQASPHIGRARLLILDITGKAVYDEVFAEAPSIFKASSLDGAETLFVAKDGLRAMRPRIR